MDDIIETHAYANSPYFNDFLINIFGVSLYMYNRHLKSPASSCGVKAWFVSD